jgi:hypothetical protein
LDHPQAAGRIDKTGRFAAGLHSLDGHDGRDDGAPIFAVENISTAARRARSYTMNKLLHGGRFIFSLKFSLKGLA